MYSIVGFSVFIGLGVDDQPHHMRYATLSYMVADTEPTRHAFLGYLIVHGTLNAYVYYNFLFPINRNAANAMAFTILTSEIGTGLFDTILGKAPHYAFTFFAFSSTLVSALLVLLLPPRKLQKEHKIQWIMSMVVVIFCAVLLIVFGAVMDLPGDPCCGPMEWTAILIASFLPALLHNWNSSGVLFISHQSMSTRARPNINTLKL